MAELNDPDHEATMQTIQRLQREDLEETGALDDWKEGRRQEEDNDYTPGMETKKPAKKKQKQKHVVVGQNSKEERRDVASNNENIRGGDGSPKGVKGEGEEATTTTAAKVKAGAKPRPKKRGSAPRGVSLLDLIKEGLMEPGQGVLKIVYKNHEYVGDLTEDGLISFEGEEWESPSAWSITVKRRLFPEKKADDGWKSVMHQGKKIEAIKHEYIKKLFGLGSHSSGLTTFQPKLELIGGPETVMIPSVSLNGVSAKEIVDSTPWPVQRPSEQTEYSKQRPKREVKRKQWIAEGKLEHGGHTMVPMEHFCGTPGSGEEGSQPFAVEVSCGCEIVMDIHSYMSERHEIIGLLGGQVGLNGGRPFLKVEEAFPVKEVTTEDNTINVEMDPESEVQVREKMMAKGMVCVGWYHSHPSFPAVPSMIDLKNQLNYQMLVRDEKLGLEPFVAGIVSPYNPKVAGLKSELSWFYVSRDNPESSFAPGAGEVDKNCRSMSLDVETIGNSQIISDCMSKIKMLAEWYSANSTDWSSIWEGDVTLLDKLIASVSERLPRNWQKPIRDTFVGAVKSYMKASWEKTIVKENLESLETVN